MRPKTCTVALALGGKEKITLLCGLAVPFALYLIYNWLLSSTLIFEFVSVNTARVVNATIHSILWAALGVPLHKMLRILWTNLLWRNLKVPNKTFDVRRHGCPGDVLCWLTSKPFCGVENVFKLSSGHTLAILTFGILYMEVFVKGLFPNVNPLMTVHRGQETEDEVDAGWFNVNMNEAVPVEYAQHLNNWYPANARPAVNEANIELDGGPERRMWLPLTLNLAEWYQVQSPVVLPEVQCQAVPLWGDRDIPNRMAYPFGRDKNITYYSYIQHRNSQEELVSRAEAATGIHFPQDADGYASYSGALDFDSQRGFFAFIMMWSIYYQAEEGPLYQNNLFPDLPLTEAGIYFTGIPCNYTLFWANVTFSNATGTMKAALASDLQLYEINMANHTIAETIMHTFESLYAPGFTTNMFDHVAHGHYGPTQTIPRDGAFYGKKLSELLAIPVYANTREAPFYRIKGKRSVTYTKIQPVSTSWGLSLILVWCLSSFFLWLFTAYLGPKFYSDWHVNSSDNSWNYLYANLTAKCSQDDENFVFYLDPTSQTVNFAQIEEKHTCYPGERAFGDFKIAV
jgi:hypothetical protein